MVSFISITTKELPDCLNTKMNPQDIKRIIDLNTKIKKIVECNTPENQTIFFDHKKILPDMTIHGFNEDLILKAFKEGLNLEDQDLYDNPNKKHPKKNYYCIYESKSIIISTRYLLVSYYLHPSRLYLKAFHTSQINKNSDEGKRYHQILNNLENSSFGKI